MSRYLITQSLLHSWAYVFECYEDGKDDAYEEFIRVLNREPRKETDAKRDGIAFETEVYKAAARTAGEPHKKWENGIQAVASIIKGAAVQARVQRNITVCGTDFLLYGVIDALKAGVIYDVKYLVKSFGSVDLAGKYINSAQHPAYLYMVPEATRFEYLVSDGQDLYREVYEREITRPIADIIAEFIPSISAMGLMDVYRKKWVAK